MFKVAVIVGSLSRSSINRKLALALARLGEGRFEPVWVEIGDLPVYNRDLDADLPASVQRFKREIEAADALLFVTPEYLRSPPAALKNTLEWGSRPYGKSSWTGKPAAVAGASPGGIGTATAQQQLRNVLAHVDVHVMGQPEAFITFKEGLIDETGEVSNEGTRKFLEGYISRFVAWVELFRSRPAS